MSEANRAALFYVKETTWGEVPTGPPTLKGIRRTGGSFAQNPSHSTSAEVRSDRVIADDIRTGIAPGGSIEFETSYAAFDDLYEGIFMSTWSTAGTVNAALTTVKTTGTVTMIAAFANMVAGQWFEIEGSADNDGYYRISVRTSDDEVIIEDPTTLGSDATAEASIDIYTDGMLRPGTTFTSYTFEEQYQDVSASFMVYRGQALGSVTLNINADSIVTGTFGDIIGGSATEVAVTRPTATVGDGTPTAAPSNSIHSAVDSIFQVREGGTANSVLLNSLTFTLSNNLRGLAAISNLGPAAILNGTVNVSGSTNGYHGTAAHAIIDKLLADTASSASFRVSDGSGNTNIWTFPTLKYTGGMPEMGGLDTDVPVNLAFVAYGDVPVQLDKFDAAP